MPVHLVDPKVAAAIRAQLKAMRDAAPYNGNMSAFARDLDITPAYLSDVLNENRGPGMKLLRALAKKLGKPLNELLGEDGGALDSDSPWHTLADWQETLASARLMFPRVRESTWKALGRLRGVAPPAMTPAALGSVAVAWDQHSAADATPPSAVPARAKKTRAA